MQFHKITYKFAMVALLGCSLMGLLLATVPTTRAASPSLSKALVASETIEAGSLVSLNEEQGNRAVLANSSNAPGLIGIAVADEDSLVAIDDDDESVQVATSGTVRAVVSSINGRIVAGDLISVSPFNGIGKKAGPGERVVGVAQSGLSSGTTSVSQQTVTDSQGNSRSIAVGYVEVNVAVGSSPVEKARAPASAMQEFAYQLIGRDVPTARLVMSGIIIVLTIAGLITLISTSIYSTTVATGRNPLAAKSIYRTLAALMGLSVLMAAFAIIAVLLLLNL